MQYISMMTAHLWSGCTLALQVSDDARALEARRTATSMHGPFITVDHGCSTAAGNMTKLKLASPVRFVKACSIAFRMDI